MTPTTILIEREADAKVFEVIEKVYPDVRWYSGGEKPTRWKPKVYPYVLIVDSDNDLTWSPLTAVHDITATEWLAQHGYVPDGDGYRPLQVGDTVEALMDYSVHDILILKAGKKYPVLSSEPDYFTIKCEIQKMQWKHSRIHEIFKYVAPVPAPHDNDSLDAMKYAMCGVVKFRTEQREKELTEQGYVKFTGNVEAYWLHPDINYIVHQFDIENQSDTDWGSNFAYATGLSKQPQPSPYTAGQEVDRIFNAETGHTKRVIFDHEHNGVAYVKYPESTYPVGVSLDSIRPVQVQPEMQEKNRCNLSDVDLIEACDRWVTKLCASGGKDWRLSVPVNFNSDPDMLFSELIRRFKSCPLITPKQVTVDQIIEMVEKRISLPSYAWEVVKLDLQKSEGGKG